jgi:hypothetical protein
MSDSIKQFEEFDFSEEFEGKPSLEEDEIDVDSLIGDFKADSSGEDSADRLGFDDGSSTEVEGQVENKESNSEEKEVAQKKKWFWVGEEGMRKKREDDKLSQAKRDRNALRFRLAAQEEALIIFVDDPVFFIYEHFNVKIKGTFGNYITCSDEQEPCPVCEAGLGNPQLIAYGTVIDTRKFERKDGTISKWRKVLFPAKKDVIDRLSDLRLQYGSLAGKAFRIKRYSEKDYVCGSTFIYKGKVDIEKYFGKDATVPIDYSKVLSLPTEAELREKGIPPVKIHGRGTSSDELILEEI